MFVNFSLATFLANTGGSLFLWLLQPAQILVQQRLSPENRAEGVLRCSQLLLGENVSDAPSQLSLFELPA